MNESLQTDRSSCVAADSDEVCSSKFCLQLESSTDIAVGKLNGYMVVGWWGASGWHYMIVVIVISGA